MERERKESTSETNVLLPYFPYIVIPSEVLFNANLTSTEKLLFGIIQNLAQGEDGCYASNSYLGNLLGVCKQTISNGIVNLEKNELIETYLELSIEKEGFKTKRKIVVKPELSINKINSITTKNKSKNNDNVSENENELSKNNIDKNQKTLVNIDENSQDDTKKFIAPYKKNYMGIQKNLYPHIKNFISPYKKIYIPGEENKENQLKNSENQLKNSENQLTDTKNFIAPYKKIYSVFKKNNKKNKNNMQKMKIDETSNTPQSKKTNNLTWSQLIEKYGRSQVKFVRYFLKKQKENFPKFIKDDISPNNSRVLTSLDCLDKLQRIDGFDFETEIKPTLEAALQDEFWARNILSLGSLRNKGRNGEKKFVNIQVTLSNRTKTSPFQSHKQSITPDDIIAEQGWDDFRIKLLKKSVFDPVFSKLNGASDKTEITKSICKLIKEIEKRQKRPKPPENEKDYQMRKFIFDKWELIPQANRILKDFVKWLDNQDWIGELKPGHFDIDGRTFAMFRNYYQDSIGGFDIFEGRML